MDGGPSAPPPPLLALSESSCCSKTDCRCTQSKQTGQVIIGHQDIEQLDDVKLSLNTFHGQWPYNIICPFWITGFVIGSSRGEEIGLGQIGDT